MVAAIVKNQHSFVYNNGAIILHHKNSRWRRGVNLNAKTADIHIKIFGTLKLSFHFLEKELKTFEHNHSMSNFGLFSFFRPNELNFCMWSPI